MFCAFCFIVLISRFYFTLLLGPLEKLKIIIFDHYLILFISFWRDFPSNKGVISEGLNNNQNRLFVISQYFHYFLTSLLEYSICFTCFHRIYKHSCQSKRYFLWIIVFHFGYLKAVPKIYMNNFTSISMKHDIERMPISKSDNISNNRHNS